jgi:hypothetical protein
MVPPALVEQPWQGWGLQGHREVVVVWWWRHGRRLQEVREEATGGMGGGCGRHGREPGRGRGVCKVRENAWEEVRGVEGTREQAGGGEVHGR